MNTKYILGSVLLSLFIFPTQVISGDDVSMKFEFLDNDGDGYISRSEATQNNRLRERWNNLDSDNDGKLTAKEFSTFTKASQEAFPDQ